MIKIKYPFTAIASCLLTLGAQSSLAQQSASSQAYSSTPICQSASCSSSIAVTEGVSCHIDSVQVWEEGFLVTFSVANTGNTFIDGWNTTLGINDNLVVNNSWGASIQNDINSINASGMDWNKNLAAGETITFGIQGEFSGDFETPTCTSDASPASTEKLSLKTVGWTVYAEGLGLSQATQTNIAFSEGDNGINYHKAWHTYNAPGTYKITLTVSDNAGTRTFSDLVTVSEKSDNQAPKAILREFLGNVYSGLSADYDEDSLSYTWIVGGEEIAPNARVSLPVYNCEDAFSTSSTPTSPAITPVIVTVSDGTLADTAQIFVTKPTTTQCLSDPLPMPIIDYKIDDMTVYLTASGRYVNKATWRIEGEDLGTQTNKMYVKHTFSEPGTYVVNLRAAVGMFSNDANEITITVPQENIAPIAAYTCEEVERTDSTALITTIHTVCSAEESYDSNQDKLSYVWTMGDGGVYTDAVIEHAYQIEGTYPIFLTVSDDIASDTVQFDHQARASNSQDDQVVDDDTQGEPHNIQCEYNVISEWSNGFTGEITLTNNSDTALDDWTVEWTFTGDNRTDNVWNANMSGENPYTATASSYNRVILPGKKVTLGFNGSKSGDIEIPILNSDYCH